MPEAVPEVATLSGPLGVAEPWPVQLFDERLRGSPGSPGSPVLLGEDFCLTIEELHLRSQRLAWRISAEGIEKSEFVAVCMPRGPGLVVALLGVWRAGKAYVPLEPSFPPQRLRFILEDSQAQLLLASAELEVSTVSTVSTPILRLLPTGELPADVNGPDVEVQPRSHLAYLIYTSGSTGTPKGVLVSQSSVCNVLHAFENSLRKAKASCDDIFVSVTTFCFDISVLEMFWPLCFGFRLYLCSSAVTRSGALLKQTLDDARKIEGTVFFQATPSSFRSLLKAGWEGGHNVEAICGGEAFPDALAEPLLLRCGKFWNAYGPTETTIWSALHQLQSSEIPVPIGGPIAGTELLVATLEGEGEIDLAEGEGELLIAGLGVADGYHRRPELTSQKFVSFPGAKATAATVFRSGDLVRLTQHSALQCLGRMDHQVKIRGFRLELGEVESVLETHPEVDAAAVLLLDAGEGSELSAFVASKDDASTLRDTLRSHLAARLPSYAVPQRLAVMESLPLLPSGKVDRRALKFGPLPPPLADAKNATDLETLDSVDWRKPSATQEALLRRTLVKLVAMVTGIQIAIEDDGLMVSLGIDSMSAVPLAELISTQLLKGAEMPLEDLYVYNTLNGLCRYLQGRLSEMPMVSTAEKRSYAQLKKSRAKPSNAAKAELPPGLEACRSGDLIKLKQMLSDGSFETSTLDRFGGSGLHWAASAGHLEVCRLLVEHKASVDFADKKSGRTALHWASRQGHLEVVQWLLAEHQIPVDVQTKDDTTPFQLAAWGGHVPLCEWLLSQKADLHHRNSWSCLAHHFAALAGMGDCCKWLHQQGVDLGATNNQGHNALHKAAYGGHAVLCAWLQENADLDPHQKDVRGQTCAALAKKAGFEDLSCQLSFQNRQPHKLKKNTKIN
ncbi:unnamed protein product [Cladocopium goreaui]|uniref:Polyketide synthase PksJ n=1 Tax=Cladocopium goreaui TaxID=2562237 RepID=A0A9P1FQ53_9DINO|nr:unnamed protein product [Cladocopium goreaui]